MAKDYQEKRDFNQTPEPPMKRKSGEQGSLTFVVQKHSARQLHYDFRLEVNGVLKSWAVAKGPSSNIANKRLAVMVEDHPLDYAGFEGVIPPGQYGSGQVIVWDKGTYSPDENGELHFGDRKQSEILMQKAIAAGKISITLKGEKLKGSWTLVKMHGSDNNWLLIKHRDEFANSEHDVLDNDASVISGSTIEDLKSGNNPTPQIKKLEVKLDKITGVLKSAFPKNIEPMLATAVPKPFSKPDWLFEPKLDGYRTLAYLDNTKVTLLSRNGVNVNKHYPALLESLQKQTVKQLVLDGEIIALDAKGKQCFQCLQGYMKALNRLHIENYETPSTLLYYVFDILYLDGYDLTKVPLQKRKELLKQYVVPTANLRFVEFFPDEGETVYKAAVQNGLEGMVAKQKDSIYEPGKRSPNWQKVKAVNTDEFLVAGYTQGTGNREKTFGALVLGNYDTENKLQWVGNVGSGFDNDLLTSLKTILDKTIAKKSPFSAKIDPVEGVTWVKPRLVVEVKFAERTQDGRLRAPVFLRVRDDKPPSAVHSAVTVPDDPSPPNKPVAAKPAGLQNIVNLLNSDNKDVLLEIEGHKVSLSNLDKAVWPETDESRALTKRDLFIYLTKVSPYLLPHLKDRPLSLSRYPDGIHGEHFFQKHYHPLPEFVETVPLSSHDTPVQDYLLCNNLSTLLWLGQIADLELHSWYSRVTAGKDFKIKLTKNAGPDEITEYPDFLVFDIDPYVYSGKETKGEEPELNRTAFSKTCEVALYLKKLLDTLQIPAFVKTSGRTGLHVFIPVLRQLDYQGTRSIAETFSKYLQQHHPGEITTDWAVEKRAGKIFLDYNQNVRGKTLASIYSPRPSPQASVSMPLKWEELNKVYPTDFTILNVPERLAKTGDLWADILDFKIDMVQKFSEFKT